MRRNCRSGKRKLLWQFTVVIKCDPVAPDYFKKGKYMKKFLFWSGLLFIMVIICICILHVSFWSNPATRNKTLEVWLVGFGSIGSFGAVVIALYLEPIKKFFLKPELDLKVSNASPMCIIENIEAGASGNEEFVDICCKIENTGGSAADKCRMVCEEILTLGADKKFSVSDENKFRPLFFTWIGDKKTELDIAASDYGYFKFAEIRTRSSELGKAPDIGSVTGSLTPYLVVCLPSRTVKNQYIQFDDDKSIIVHFRIACSGCVAKERYVQIVWEGKSIADFRKHPEKLAITDVTDSICSLRR